MELNNEQHQLVHDTEAEKVVLAALFENNENIYGLEKGDDASLFYDSTNQRIFNATRKLIQQGTTADIITVSQYFMEHPSNDNPTPQQVVEHTYAVSTADTKHQLEVLRELRDRRKIWKICQQASQVGWNMAQDSEEAKQAIRNLMDEEDATADKGTVTMAQAVDSLGKQIAANRAGHGTKGLPTGFKLIDQKGGLHTDDLTIIAGETSQGKSALAMTITANMAAAENPVAVYSMEMAAQQLTARIMAAKTGIDAGTMLYQPLTDTQAQLFQRAGEQAKALPIFFDEGSTSSLEHIIASIKTLRRKNGIKAAVIDYLQILGRNAKERVTNTEQFYGDAARRLKNLAKEQHICVIALSQLSRDRQNPEPSISRLRASGQIEEAADNVLMVYRPVVYGRRYPEPFKDRDTHDTAELIIGKGRNIGIGKAIIGFKPELTCFFDYEGDAPKADPLSTEAMNDDEPF